ncbi:MAG: hypothetical protein Q8922_09585 [Bacteroidota bacterium]|nr:hypothetical protein [Bacteroidota bacterium]MDP4234443.1 hypothetical protein [Bacteroidota bacterium]MDP4243975.1 hypothetical protein [Bacteroidota bacterium]MDP4288175.1 hypothetical protein [Bacteroidota bacterium]
MFFSTTNRARPLDDNEVDINNFSSHNIDNTIVLGGGDSTTVTATNTSATTVDIGTSSFSGLLVLGSYVLAGQTDTLVPPWGGHLIVTVKSHCSGQATVVVMGDDALL